MLEKQGNSTDSEVGPDSLEESDSIPLSGKRARIELEEGDLASSPITTDSHASSDSELEAVSPHP